ncbi:hypothetical protein RR11_726 [Ruegeria sp. R11]|nr:hypothetical protein RR11_726 [Ruegeria sp. R11]
MYRGMRGLASGRRGHSSIAARTDCRLLCYHITDVRLATPPTLPGLHIRGTHRCREIWAGPVSSAHATDAILCRTSITSPQICADGFPQPPYPGVCRQFSEPSKPPSPAPAIENWR